MLKLAESIGSFASLAPSPFSARIKGFYETYGQRDFARFWADGCGTAVASVDGNTVVECGADADYEELKLFLGFIGYSTVTAEEKVLTSLDIAPSDSSFIVEYSGKNISDTLSPVSDTKELYALLNVCGFSMGSYPDFALDLVARLRTGTAFSAEIHDSGRLAAGASALFIADDCVLLGAVATHPDFRGRGFASRLVTSLAEKYVGQGRRVFLQCREDSLLDFYSAIGFEPVGRWALAGKEK